MSHGQDIATVVRVGIGRRILGFGEGIPLPALRWVRRLGAL